MAAVSLLACLPELLDLMLISDSFRCSLGTGERMTLDCYICLRPGFSYNRCTYRMIGWYVAFAVCQLPYGRDLICAGCLSSSRFKHGSGRAQTRSVPGPLRRICPSLCPVSPSPVSLLPKTYD